jgi:hypothetical protein
VIRSIRFSFLSHIVLLIVLLSVSLAAQTGDRDKEQKSKKPAGDLTGNLVNVEATVHCAKAEPSYALEVPDRPGHKLMIAQRKCTWTKPLKILDASTKDGVFVGFTELMEGIHHQHGFEVDTLEDGEKLTMRIMGETPVEGVANKTTGRWSFMRGTGKFKGIKGGGTYEGQVQPDGSYTLNLEGAYVPAEMAAEKKNNGGTK